MALVAIEPDSQEEMRRVFEDIFRGSQNLKVRSSWVLAIRARRRHDLIDEGIVRRILGNLFANPIAEAGCTFFAEELGVDLQQIAPLVGPMVHVVVASQQFVDQSVSLLLRRSWVSEKLANLFGCWRQTGQV